MRRGLLDAVLYGTLIALYALGWLLIFSFGGVYP